MKNAKKTGKIGFKPLGDRVLVKPEEAKDKKSPGGIIIPDTAKEKPEYGVVIAVGPGKRNEHNIVVPISVEVGDMVMFSKYGYDEVKINDEEYYVVSESNIIGKF